MLENDAGHNYNQASRNAVFAWFGKWLFGSDDGERFSELPFTADKPEDLRVFGDGPLPDHAVDEAALVQYLIERSETQLEKLRPEDTKSLRKFRQIMSVACRAAIGATVPAPEDLLVTPCGRSKKKGSAAQTLYLSRKAHGDRIPATLYIPDTPSGGATLVVHPEGHAGLIDAEKRTPGPILQALLKRGQHVMTVDAFMTGAAQGQRNTEEVVYMTTYNHTDTSNRVQDIITGITYLRERANASAVSVVGIGEAGLWCLLACGLDPHIARAAIDTDQFDNDDDQAYLDRLFIPCLRRAGDFRTVAALAAPAALLLHNTGSAFRTEWIEDVYRVANARDRLRVQHRRTPIQDVVSWVVDGPSDTV